MRPVVDDEQLKTRLDAFVAREETRCTCPGDIPTKSVEYHEGRCPRFKAWRAEVRAARAAGGGSPQTKS